MSDIYKTPESELNKKMPIGKNGSLERGIAGDYEFSIGGILSESWEKTAGAKGTLNLAGFFYFLVAIAVMVVIQVVVGSYTSTNPEASPGQVMAISMSLQLLSSMITMPVVMGLFLLGLRRAVGVPIESASVFSHFGKGPALLGTVIIMYIMMMIGFLLLVLPGIYLMVAYFMAMPLVVEKGLSPWQALEASRKAVSKHWFGFLGLYIVLILIIMISAIPLGIGLIWTVPMLFIAWGIMYRNMFGCEAKTAA